MFIPISTYNRVSRINNDIGLLSILSSIPPYEFWCAFLQLRLITYGPASSWTIPGWTKPFLQ